MKGLGFKPVYKVAHRVYECYLFMDIEKRYKTSRSEEKNILTA